MYPEAEVVHQGVPPMLDARCAVRVNGQSTAWFPVQRGVKQGDPISGILSVLVLNVLAIQLESSPSLGVHCYRENRATAQFADDLNVMVVGNENVNRALTIIIHRLAILRALLSFWSKVSTDRVAFCLAVKPKPHYTRLK